MAISKQTADLLLREHLQVQNLTQERRKIAGERTQTAKQAQAEGATIPDIQVLLGLSRTGVVKILAGRMKATK